MTTTDTRQFGALGTTVTVAVTDPAALDAAVGVVRAHVAALDGAASRFRVDSVLTRLNGAAGAPVEVSDLFLHLMADALAAAESTGGLVNPTVGVALEQCGYDRTFSEMAPSGSPIVVRYRPVPGWQGIAVDRAAHTVTLPVDVRLDLGATAKAGCADGAALDAAATIGSGVLVNLGGDLAVAGEPPPGGWSVRIADRHDARASDPGVTVAVVSGGLATSGTAARRWMRGGRTYHHIIDPSTGAPTAPCWRTVTVAASTCLAANVAATASVILGGDAVCWLAGQGRHARLVAEDGTTTAVGSWPQDAVSPVLQGAPS